MKIANVSLIDSTPFVQLVTGVLKTELPLLCTSSAQGSAGGQSLARLEEKAAVVVSMRCRIKIFHGFHLFI